MLQHFGARLDLVVVGGILKPGPRGVSMGRAGDGRPVPRGTGAAYLDVDSRIQGDESESAMAAPGSARPTAIVWGRMADSGGEQST